MRMCGNCSTSRITFAAMNVLNAVDYAPGVYPSIIYSSFGYFIIHHRSARDLDQIPKLLGGEIIAIQVGGQASAGVDDDGVKRMHK